MSTKSKSIIKQIALLILFNLFLFSFVGCSSDSDVDSFPPDNIEQTETTYEKTVFMIVGYDAINQDLTEPIYEVVRAEFDSEDDSLITVLYVILTNRDLLDSYVNIWSNSNDNFCPNTTMFIKFNLGSCELPLLINPDLDEATQLERHLNESIFNYEHVWLSTIVGDNYTRDLAIDCIIE